MRAVLTLTVAALVAAPALAASMPRDSYCSLIKQTEDGKFTVERKLGWNLLLEEMAEGTIEYAPDIVGVTCLRTPLKLMPDDLESLKQGKTLTFSEQQMVLVKFELKDGKIIWTNTAGVLDKKARKAVEKSVEEVQKLVTVETVK